MIRGLGPANQSRTDTHEKTGRVGANGRVPGPRASGERRAPAAAVDLEAGARK